MVGKSRDDCATETEYEASYCMMAELEQADDDDKPKYKCDTGLQVMNLVISSYLNNLKLIHLYLKMSIYALNILWKFLG